MGFHRVTGTQSSILSKREKRIPEEAAGGWSTAGRAKDSPSQQGWEDAGGSTPVLPH